MNKEQFQIKHGFCDEDMDILQCGINIFGGRITAVNNYTWEKEKIIIANENKISLSRRSGIKK